MKRSYYVILLILNFCVFSCIFQKHKVSWNKRSIPCFKKIVIIGFRPVSPIFTGSSYVRCPISGDTFRGSMVPEEVTEYMTSLLIKKLAAKNTFTIISYDQVKKEFLDLKDSIDNAQGKLLVEYLNQIGKAFKADAVILGHIFRWEQRIGTDFASSRPASVAFDLHIVDTAHGQVVWEAEFDKTQRSLSENLLDIKTFIKGKGKWMTAEQLADMGLSNMIKNIIKSQKSCSK